MTLGITGSIIAYRAAHVVRGLVKKRAEVQAVITPAGREFITPFTLSTLSSHPVINEFFSNRDGTWNSHVDPRLWANAMLTTPATASTIGKMTNGIANDILMTTRLSCKAPVFMTPVIDLNMFAHPGARQNLEHLRSFGNRIIEPAEGELASHLAGKGRMEEPDRIIEVLEDFSSAQKDLEKEKISITAGPTYEKIDPVCFIDNYSSDKMGFALAEAYAERGAEVTLVAGPVSLETHHPAIKRIDVESAGEMYQTVMTAFPSSDTAILRAAIADHRPENASEQKIKRETERGMTLHLVLNPNIATSSGVVKQEGQVMVGFTLETNDEAAHTEGKLKRKNLDFIVLNPLRDQGAGLRCDTSKITVVDNAGGATSYPFRTKQEVTYDIVNKLVTLLK